VPSKNKILVKNDGWAVFFKMSFGAMLKGFLVIVFLPYLWAASPVVWIENETEIPKRPDLSEVAWTGSSFLVAGENYVAESPDGETWTSVDLSAFPEESYWKIVVGPDLLILGSDHGLRRSATPGEGDEWVSFQVPDSWRSGTLVFDGSRYLVVQGDQSLLESSDGQAWEVVAGAPPLSFYRMVAGNGFLLGFGSHTFYQSADGLTWTEVNLEEVFNPEGENEFGFLWNQLETSHVEFSGGKFVVSMIRDLEYDNNTYAVSSDGLAWTLADVPPYEVDEDSGTTGFTLGGGGGEEFGVDLKIDLVHLTDAGVPVVVYYSRNAINLGLPWDESDREAIASVASNSAGVVVAAGSNGFLIRSDKPLEDSWSEVGIQTAMILDARSSGEKILGLWGSYNRMGGFIEDETQIRMSLDGLIWEDVFLPEGASYDGLTLSLVNDRWFLIGYDALHTSSDGITWVAEDFVSVTVSGGLGDEEEITPLASIFGNGVYLGTGISVGFQGSLFGYEGAPPIGKSTDGIHWTPLPEQLSEVTSVAFGGGEFMALEKSRGFRSRDGETWEEFQVEGLPDAPTSLEYFRGRWLASSPEVPFWSPGFKMISDNGRSWEFVDAGLVFGPPTYSGLFEVNGYHLAGRRGPSVLSSKSGLVWEVSDPAFGEQFFIRSANWFTVPLADRLVTVGDNYQTVRSEPLVPAGAPKGLEFIDASHLEAEVSPLFEWRLEYSASMSEEVWTPEGEWRSVTEADPYLYWKSSAGGERGFYRLGYRPLGD